LAEVVKTLAALFLGSEFGADLPEAEVAERLEFALALSRAVGAASEVAWRSECVLCAAAGLGMAEAIAIAAMNI